VRKGLCADVFIGLCAYEFILEKRNLVPTDYKLEEILSPAGACL